MTDIKQIAKDFESLKGYPLKSDPRTKTFTTNDKKKLQFLESIKEFSKKYPKINYYDLGLELNKDNKKYFPKRFEGLIEFYNNPLDIKALDKMLTGYQNKDALKQDISDNYRPQLFEVVDEEEKVIYIIPPAKQIPKSDNPAVMGAGQPTDEDIRNVMTPRLRATSKKQKEMSNPINDVTERVEALKTDSVGNVIDSEDAPRVLTQKELDDQDKEIDDFLDDLIADTTKEVEQEQSPPATATPATMSPDERDEAIGLSSKSLDDMIKKMEEQLEAEEDAKKKEILRQEIEKAKAEAEEKRKTDIATMTLGKGSATGKVEEIKIQDIPQDIRAIPKERASTTGKSEAQLKDDMTYFFNTYPDMLKKQKGQYLTIIRGKSPALRKKQLIELHRRIVGLVGNVEENDIGKKIGIVLNADKYLDDKINAILLSKITQGMTAGSLVVNVTDKTKDDKSKRVGSYQITKGRSGLLNAQKAPVYRSIPSTNDSQDRRSNRPIKLKTLPTQRWDEVNTAKKQMRLDPFEPKREKVNRFDIYL